MTKPRHRAEEVPIVPATPVANVLVVDVIEEETCQRASASTNVDAEAQANDVEAANDGNDATMLVQDRDLHSLRTAAVTPLPLSVDEPSEPRHLVKRGHIFFWVCCDVRIATIASDILLLIVVVITVVVYFWIGFAGSFLDSESNADLIAFENHPSFVTSKLILEIFFAILGIWGALRYRSGYILASGVWHILSFLTNGLFLNVVGMAMSLGSAYPHFVLANEVRNGVMNEETYESRERYSCCCK